MEGFSDPAALVTADNNQPGRSDIGREGQTYDMLHTQLCHDSDRINYRGQRMPFIRVKLE